MNTVPEQVKCACECEHTHRDLVVESLTVKRPGGKGSAVIASHGGTMGVWVSSGVGQECIGLIVQEGVGPYLAIYDQEARGVPTALTRDGLQLHNDQVTGVTTIPLTDLAEALRLVRAKHADGGCGDGCSGD